MGKTELQVSSKLIVGLVCTSVACALLAVFQWMELIVAQRGGALSCSISETINCAAVWNAPLAKAIQEHSFVPVAGWGLIWSLGALWSVLRLNAAALSTRVTVEQIIAVRLFAAVGVATSLVMGAVSFSVGAVCITCIATYWLVLMFAVFAYILPSELWPRSMRDFAVEAARAGVAIIFAYLLVLYPGTKTPTTDALSLKSVVKTADAVEDNPPPKPDGRPNPLPSIPKSLDDLIDSFPAESLQMFSDAIARIRARTRFDVTAWPTRFRRGSANSPAHIVEFTDIKCGHCARLVMELKELERLATPGAFSLEPRQFPLDYECNKSVGPKLTDGTGVRCAAARALICLEGQNSFWNAQLEMFKVGPALTKTQVLKIARELAEDPNQFRQCLTSKDTQNKLEQDIAYANKYELTGTPLLLINGREVEPIGALIFAMVLAGGKLEAPAFSKLPPPSPDALKDPHAGHGH